jgi:hypothetical protein
VINASLQSFLARSLAPSEHFTPVFDAESAVAMLWLFGSPCITLVTFLVIWRDQRPGSVDRTFALIVLASLLNSPLGWIYYLWLGLPAAIALLAYRDGLWALASARDAVRTPTSRRRPESQFNAIKETIRLLDQPVPA